MNFDDTQVAPVPYRPRLILGRHISRDGGLNRAAKSIVNLARRGELEGASMVINSPKRSVEKGFTMNWRLRRTQRLQRAWENIEAIRFGRIVGQLGKELREVFFSTDLQSQVRGSKVDLLPMRSTRPT